MNQFFPVKLKEQTSVISANTLWGVEIKNAGPIFLNTQDGIGAQAVRFSELFQSAAVILKDPVVLAAEPIVSSTVLENSLYAFICKVRCQICCRGTFYLVKPVFFSLGFTRQQQ